ncbi:U2 small nuclear ribonucleoprotein auxiliary factor 35 kDa subunit protein 2 [Paragonimus heterotremus]|uniref:U2 small nuclear ribonucleoprotein auxiliary factor 35 kDa subunit protein 2 n=1 Tax=Paragonimus heterotremus TaxID=100268 RepID=A0A8J4SQC1_9TREM|nr:U2 small nuclear ribonucleoprotein auxiliary factor 35 kDa subunit protein 2 [Paragonimus heterotremus]
MSSQDITKLSHRARRAILKKMKRKRLRQALAQAREQHEADELAKLEASPSYQQRLKDEEEQLRLETLMRERDEQTWLAREEEARRQWLEKQSKKIIIHDQNVKETVQQPQIFACSDHTHSDGEIPNAITSVSIKVDHLSVLILQLLAPNVVSSSPEDLPPWHHPPLPANIAPLLQPTVSHTPLPERCSFFRKTGACRYGLSCSRRHDYPQRFESVLSENEMEDDLDHSCLVLCIPHMFTHYCLPAVKTTTSEELEDPDSLLEADETRLLTDYEEFYVDVRAELESRWGRISALRTCRNRTEHLRGTVYVEFALGPGAAWDAAEALTGRWFASQQLTCIVARLGGGWREAVCGLYHRGRCPKGDLRCNFLHVFLNPGETIHDLHRALRLQRGELRHTDREIANVSVHGSFRRE